MTQYADDSAAAGAGNAANDPNVASEFDDLRPEVRVALSEALGHAGGRTRDWHREARWAAVQDTLRDTLQDVLKDRQGARPQRIARCRRGASVQRSTMPRFSAYARMAGIVCAGAAVVALLVTGVPQRLWQPIDGRPSHLTSATYTTKPTERREVTLADGTRVLLNVASSIRVLSDFGMTGRNIQLDGEAMFSVVPNSSKPFTIRSGTALITVLGTQFSVRRYADDDAVQVAVKHGRVSLQRDRERQSGGSSTGGEAILSANTFGELMDSGRIVVTEGADIQSVMAWTQGKLIFRETPFLDAIRDLERHYGVSIVVNDPSLRHEQLTATFTNETATEAAALIAMTFNVRYTSEIRRDGTTITFLPARSGAASAK